MSLLAAIRKLWYSIAPRTPSGVEEEFRFCKQSPPPTRNFHRKKIRLAFLLDISFILLDILA
jgi:hypothetical protein